MRRSGCPTKGGNWEVSLQAQKCELSPSVGYHPTQKSSSFVPVLNIDHILKKKVSLIAFRQILPKTMSVACIFSYTNMTYLKKLDETKSLNTKQCVAGLSSRITPQVSPFLPKMPPPLILPFCTNQVWTVPPPLPLDLYEKLWSWGEGGVGVGILLNNQKFSHFPHHKNPPSCIYIFCYQKCHSFPIK